jgi:hypothetical protein
LLGEDAYWESLLDSTTLPATMTASREQQEGAYAALTDADAFVDALCRAAAPTDPLGPHAAGILGASGLPAAPAPPAADEQRALAWWLVARTAALEQDRIKSMGGQAFVAGMLKRQHPELSDERLVERLLALVAPDPRRPVAPELRARLRCPDCRAPLDAAPGGVRCGACGTDFPSDYGVPILHPVRPPDDDALARECLERLAGSSGARRRTLERLVRRLRRNERPAGRLRRAVWAVAEGRRPF